MSDRFLAGAGRPDRSSGSRPRRLPCHGVAKGANRRRCRRSSGPSTRLRAWFRRSSATRSSRSSAAVRSATRASSDAFIA